MKAVDVPIGEGKTALHERREAHTTVYLGKKKRKKREINCKEKRTTVKGVFAKLFEGGGGSSYRGK